MVELTAQAAAAGAQGAALARVLARLEPLLLPEQPPARDPGPAVPPVQPAPEPPGERGWPDGLERCTLREGWERQLLPWKPETVRTYFARSKTCGIPVPDGVQDRTKTVHYTEQELRTWLEAWTAQSGVEAPTLPEQQSEEPDAVAGEQQ